MTPELTCEHWKPNTVLEKQYGTVYSTSVQYSIKHGKYCWQHEDKAVIPLPMMHVIIHCNRYIS